MLSNCLPACGNNFQILCYSEQANRMPWLEKRLSKGVRHKRMLSPATTKERTFGKRCLIMQQASWKCSNGSPVPPRQNGEWISSLSTRYLPLLTQTPAPATSLTAMAHLSSRLACIGSSKKTGRQLLRVAGLAGCNAAAKCIFAESWRLIAFLILRTVDA